MQAEHWDDNGQAVQVSESKWRSDGTLPLLLRARQALDSCLGWRVRKGVEMVIGEPLFRSLSRNGYGKRLKYWGIFEMVKDLGAIAESSENVHPHRLRHTFGRQLVMGGMSPDYVRKLMRIKSPVTSECYTKRALEKKAGDAFNELIEHSKSGDGLF